MDDSFIRNHLGTCPKSEYTGREDLCGICRCRLSCTDVECGVTHGDYVAWPDVCGSIHAFHYDCIRSCITSGHESHNRCPMCRREMFTSGSRALIRRQQLPNSWNPHNHRWEFVATSNFAGRREYFDAFLDPTPSQLHIGPITYEWGRRHSVALASVWSEPSQDRDNIFGRYPATLLPEPLARMYTSVGIRWRRQAYQETTARFPSLTPQARHTLVEEQWQQRTQYLRDLELLEQAHYVLAVDDRSNMLFSEGLMQGYRDEGRRLIDRLRPPNPPTWRMVHTPEQLSVILEHNFPTLADEVSSFPLLHSHGESQMWDGLSAQFQRSHGQSPPPVAMQGSMRRLRLLNFVKSGAVFNYVSDWGRYAEASSPNVHRSLATPASNPEPPRQTPIRASIGQRALRSAQRHHSGTYVARQRLAQASAASRRIRSDVLPRTGVTTAPSTTDLQWVIRNPLPTLPTARSMRRRHTNSLPANAPTRFSINVGGRGVTFGQIESDASSEDDQDSQDSQDDDSIARALEDDEDDMTLWVA